MGGRLFQLFKTGLVFYVFALFFCRKPPLNLALLTPFFRLKGVKFEGSQTHSSITYKLMTMETLKNPIVWTEIYVSDIARAQKFYETVLKVQMQAAPVPAGMEADKDSEEYFEMVFFPGNMTGPGSSGAIVKSAMFKPGPGGTLIYFECEDCATEISRVEAAGGKVIAAKMPIGEYGFCGICSDTEGNSIGFHSMK